MKGERLAAEAVLAQSRAAILTAEGLQEVEGLGPVAAALPDARRSADTDRRFWRGSHERESVVMCGLDANRLRRPWPGAVHRLGC